MKKLISILLVLAMVLALAPMVFASEEAGIEEEAIDEIIIDESIEEPAEAPALDGDTHSGTCGTNVSWSLDTSTGVLTISGTGYMDDYESYDSMPWYSYRDSIKSVVIKDGVKSVGELAFFYHDAMTSVTIGNSVETIKDSAFQYSENLTSVTLGNSVKTIGQFAFHGCDLKSVKIPDSVVSIGDFAFCNNEYLTSVTFGNSLETIGDNAFDGCDLHSLTLPDSVTTIEEEAFEANNNLKSVTIPSSVTSIGDHAFGYDGSYKPLDGFTITAYAGSAGEQYAKDNGFHLILLERPAFSGDIALTGLTLPAAGAEARADAKLSGSGCEITVQNWYKGFTSTPVTSFEAGEFCSYTCDVQVSGGGKFERIDSKYAGTVTLNGETLEYKKLTSMKDEYLGGKSPVKGYFFRDDTTLVIAYICELPAAEPPTLTFAADAKSVKASGDFSSLYARVALVIDNNGVSGLYVTQATINTDGTILIPEFMIPGLKVKGVNVTLVPTLADIQSTTPNAKATATKMLST